MGEEQDGIAHIEYADADHYQVYQRDHPRLHRKDEENHKLAVGIHGGKGQHHTQMQIIGHISIESGKYFRRNEHIADNDILCRAKYHSKDVHHHDTHQIKKVKLKGADGALYGAAQAIEEIKEQDGKQTAAQLFGQQPGKQPPNLPLQNSRFVKAQKIVQKIPTVDHADEGYDTAA